MRAILTQAAKLPAKAHAAMREMLLNRAGDQSFHNTSKFAFDLLKANAAGIDAARKIVIRQFPSWRHTT